MFEIKVLMSDKSTQSHQYFDPLVLTSTPTGLCVDVQTLQTILGQFNAVLFGGGVHLHAALIS